MLSPSLSYMEVSYMEFLPYPLDLSLPIGAGIRDGAQQISKSARRHHQSDRYSSGNRKLSVAHMAGLVCKLYQKTSE